MSDLPTLQKRALEIQNRYAELNNMNGHKEWEAKDFALGFAGDFGDLMKLVMAKDNLRKIENADSKLAHELSDCLWSLLILAHKFEVDLEKEFLKTMDELEVRIAGEAS